MKIENINTSDKVFIIAEIGNNHEGSFDLAQEMIEKAAASGSDAVKFQTIIPEKLVTSAETARIEQLSRFKFSYQQYEELAKTAQQNGVLFMSTPFDIESAQFLNTIVPAYKIASSDNNFYPLLEEVAKTGKPIIMSAGMAQLSDISTSVDFIRNSWKQNNINGELAIMHCVSNYPTLPEEANLDSIRFIKENLAVTPGYSDHTLGTEAAVLSVALGARIIEKHFTIDNNYSDFRDHQISANPEDMKTLVDRVRQAETLLGAFSKPVGDNEQKMKLAARRSVAAKVDLSKGAVLKLEDFTWLRPGTGVQVGDEDQLIGKAITRDINAGELIQLSDIG